MNPTTDPSSNIPILTEIISIENGTEATSLAENEVSQPDQANLIQGPSFEELEKTLQENVLRQLLTRVDFVLEHRIRDGLAEVLQTATDDLAKEIRQGLTKSLEELIHRTINQEISKIQSLKAQDRG
jgi:hypothetical protein